MDCLAENNATEKTYLQPAFAMIVVDLLIAYIGLKWLKLYYQGYNILTIRVMTSAEENVEASIRVTLLLLLDCSSCQSYQRVQRTLPCQHTVCNKCIERSRRTGVLTCADCGTLHKIPKEWTRLFPVNLQLKQIAVCADTYYSPQSASPKEDETAVFYGGRPTSADGDDEVINEDTVMAMLVEQLNVLETSEEIYHNILSRIEGDINNLVQSGRRVKLVITERMEELLSLVRSRQENLFEQIDTLERSEIDILNTQFRESQKEIQQIKAFCIEARNVLSERKTEENISKMERFISTSSDFMEMFRRAKTSRSRVPKVIVLIDRSAPKKRLKANINTYGKIIVEPASTTSTDIAEEVLSENVIPPVPEVIVTSEPAEQIVKIRTNRILSHVPANIHVHNIPNLRTGGINYLRRHPSIDSVLSDSGASDSGISGISLDSPVDSKEPAQSGAIRKTRSPIHRDHLIQSSLTYSNADLKLRIGTLGKGRDDFNVPKGVTAVKDDIFAVADCGNNAVKLFQSFDGSALECIDCDRYMKFPLPSVVDVCTFGGTSLLVSISRMGQLMHYTTKGKYLGVLDVTGKETFSDIWGITTDIKKNIYICDRANGCVLMFDKTITKKQEFRSDNKNSRPFYVTIGPHNCIYTTDSMSNTVLVYTPEGKKIQEVKGENKAKRFEEVAGLTFDSTGNLLVVDRGQRKIIVMEPRMEHRYIFGNDVEASIGTPEDIAVLANGNVVVSDTLHHQTLIF